MRRICIALGIIAAAAARPQPCADEVDSETFKFKLYDDVSVTCDAISKKPQPTKNNLCERGKSEDGRLSRGQEPASTAAESCPVACGTCRYEAFSHGRLTLKAPTINLPSSKSRVFQRAWRELGQRYPIARTVVLVDVPFQRELHHPRYDALYVMGDDESARSVWRRGGASLVVRADLLSATRALPFAERAADIVVADLSAPRATGATVIELRKYLIELTRILAEDGPLVLLKSEGLNLERWISNKKSRADICRDVDDAYSCEGSGKGCVAPRTLLRRSQHFENVYERIKSPPSVANACCFLKGRKETCERRCFRFTRGDERAPTIQDPTRQSLVLGETVSVGRLRYWDVRRLLKSYDSSWATKYARDHQFMWHQIYVGNHGFLPDKREWSMLLTQRVLRGNARSILDAGAGTCSLDAHLRKHGLRSRVRLVSFGFYDCSMARVASERGSLIFDWSWLDPLPFCPVWKSTMSSVNIEPKRSRGQRRVDGVDPHRFCPHCKFDIVFQAEGIHHSVPRKQTDERLREFCPSYNAERRRLASPSQNVSRRLAWRRAKKKKKATPRRPRRTHKPTLQPTHRPTTAIYREEFTLVEENQKHGRHKFSTGNKQKSGSECVHALWKRTFDNLGSAVACGGVLFITDLLGDVFTGGGPRCWPEFGLQWARENGFVPVRVQPGDPCAFQYPFLYLSKPCKAGALLVNSLFF